MNNILFFVAVAQNHCSSFQANDYVFQEPYSVMPLSKSLVLKDCIINLIFFTSFGRKISIVEAVLAAFSMLLVPKVTFSIFSNLRKT